MSDPTGPNDRGDYRLLAADVRKRYPDGDVRALDGVTVGVRAAEFLAVTGPSGCGKSTLLNLLGALDRPDAGGVFFDGALLPARRALDRFRARQIGFVFQSFFLLPALTVRENVQVPMLEGPPRPAGRRAARADELLDLVGMAHRRHHRPGKLSVGERQRVALARALANDPPVLLADEPTGNLDSDTAGRVLDLLTGLQRSRGLAMVVVTHSPDLAARADRVTEMKDGRVVSAGGLPGP